LTACGETRAGLPLRSPSEVRAAFGAVGVSLQTVSVGKGSAAIVSLETVRSARLGYAVGVLVFRTERAASALYGDDAPGWRYSGASTRRVVNLVIVVWPHGTTNGVRGVQRPLPLAIRRVLARLSSGVRT
jgi:hypothetical protein